MIRVAIANQQRALPLNRTDLRRIVRHVLDEEGIKGADISLAFVDDPTMACLNQQYLNHEGPTDVITFPLSAPDHLPLSGEIVISTDTAARQAQELGHHAADEAALYVIHGLLHLCGYDDHRASDRRKMRARESHHLRRLGIALQE